MTMVRQAPMAATQQQTDASTDDAPIIESRGVGVRFGRQQVLRNINLRVPRGETLAIIGESGCGKTVLLKTLIALIRPTDGSVWFDGQDLSKLDERHLARLRGRVGFVFQNAALFDSMTVGQNVAFPLRQQGRFSDAEMQRLVFSHLAEVGLPESVVYKKPAELSGGMRKRVGLARALVTSPEVLLYDEPTTGLDPIMSDVINELMMRTRETRPVTSLIVTHDMRTANKVAERVVMLYPLSRLTDDEPQVLFDGIPTDLEQCGDQRVVQFVRGEAGERLMELREQGARIDE